MNKIIEFFFFLNQKTDFETSCRFLSEAKEKRTQAHTAHFIVFPVIIALNALSLFIPVISCSMTYQQYQS